MEQVLERKMGGSLFEHVEFEIYIVSKWRCQVGSYIFIKRKKAIR